MDTNESFWNQKYLAGETGWDIGYISTPIKEYIDQLTNKKLKILIPGGGNSYEAEYLFEKGFKDVYIVDISAIPLKNFKKRVPAFPSEKLLHSDFFKLNETYDLILEQTFFCALLPKLRKDYVEKMNQLLQPKGKLVGLLFISPLNIDKPPYGGSETEYRNLFSDNFKIEIMENSYNSIPPRKGQEFFIKLLKVNV